MAQVNVGYIDFSLVSDDSDKVIRAALTSSGAGEDDGLGGVLWGVVYGW